jgi:hypothetical protein
MANVNINEIDAILDVDITGVDSLIILDNETRLTRRISLNQLNTFINGNLSLTASNIDNFTEDVRAQFTAGTDITIVDGVISSTAEGGASTPGGPENSLQFHSGSSLSGSALLVYDYDTNTLSGTTAQFTSVAADGTSLTNLTIGEAEDSDYTDGLFTDFTSATKVGHAIDRINEVLKAVAPSQAPALSNLERNTSGGTSMKLSFGASEELVGYIDVTASLDGLSNVDAAEVFSVTNGGGGRPIRLGVFSSTQTITLILNNSVSENAGDFTNYPDDSFNVSSDGVGSFTLEVNGADVTPTGSTTDTTSYSANNFVLSLANTASFTGTGASFESFRHRTGTVSIPTGQWRNGHNYAKVTHVSSLGTHETNYIDWIYDPASTNGGGQDYLFVGTTINNFSISGQKNLSGVRYYTACSFDFDTEVYKYYRNTYPNTANGGITFTGLTSGLSAAAFTSTPDFVSGYNDPLARSSTHTVGNARILGSTLTSTMSINNGLGKTATDTLTTDSVLIDKVNTSNSTTQENFCLENYRVPSASYDSQVSLSSATFDSLSHLSASDLASYNGSLRYPTQILNGGDVAGSGVTQMIAGQPDYSSATEDRYYFRRFQNGAGAKASFTFSVTGQNVEFADYTETLSGNKVKIWVKVPGKTGWRDIMTPAPGSTSGVALNDNVGCLQGSAPSDLGGSSSTSSFIVNLLTEGLAASEYYVFRIQASDDWTGNISRLQIS